jgi:serine phosphatase RsbU (regulator of sigma subunit)
MNDQSLEEVVLQVNQLLTHDLPPAKFITAAVGILDPEEHAMQMFSAGHGPLLFYRAETDSVEELPVDALPLGLMDMDREKSERSAREVRFMPGDMLIWVTDGFFEWAKADGELYGTDRLKEAVCLRHAASPTDLIAELHRDVLSFVGGTEQIDDLTAVVVKRCL